MTTDLTIQKGEFMTEDKLIPIDKVMERAGIRTTSIYDKIKAGEFPKPIKLSKKAVRWSNNAISEWVGNPNAWAQNHPNESM